MALKQYGLMLQRTLTLVALIAAVVFTRTTSASEQSVMFSAGDGYERFMGRWSRDLAPLLVKCAGVRNGDAVLDVGSGTGALTAAIAEVGLRTGHGDVAGVLGRSVALNPAADSRDERHMPLSRTGELDALWREHRLQDVSEEALEIRMRFSSFDDYWAPFLEKQGPAGEYVASLRASEREQLRLRLRRRLLGDGPDRPIELAGRAWAARGIVPR